MQGNELNVYTLQATAFLNHRNSFVVRVVAEKGPRGPRGPNKRKLMENGQLPMPGPGPEATGEPRIKVRRLHEYNIVVVPITIGLLVVEFSPNMLHVYFFIEHRTSYLYGNAFQLNVLVVSVSSPFLSFLADQERSGGCML